MEIAMIVFDGDEEIYANVEEMEEICKRGDALTLFQTTAVYLDFVKEMNKEKGLPFLKSKEIGSQAAYDYMKIRLAEITSEEFMTAVVEQIDLAIKKEKDEPAG